jgi:hypothetical protein
MINIILITILSNEKNGLMNYQNFLTGLRPVCLKIIDTRLLYLYYHLWHFASCNVEYH